MKVPHILFSTNKVDDLRDEVFVQDIDQDQYMEIDGKALFEEDEEYTLKDEQSRLRSLFMTDFFINHNRLITKLPAGGRIFCYIHILS